jgi:hypothetical protein
VLAGVAVPSVACSTLDAGKRYAAIQYWIDQAIPRLAPALAVLHRNHTSPQDRLARYVPHSLTDAKKFSFPEKPRLTSA